jgi:competence protein ComEC
MLRASLCLLAGMLLPQLSSFSAAADFLRGRHSPAEASLVPAAFVLALLLLTNVMAPALRRGLLWFAAGVALFGIQIASVMQSRLPESYAGDSFVADVRISDFPRQSAAGVSFSARASGNPRIPTRLQLTWYDAPVSLRLGDVWRMELRLKPPHGTYNPGGADTEKWLFRNRVGATGYVVAGPRNRLLDSRTAVGISALRERFVERARREVTDSQAAAVIVALVVGAGHLLSDEQWDRYAATGTSHLMAISGLHVAMAAAGAYALLSALLGLAGGSRNPGNLALIGSLACAMAYTLVSGSAVPAQRAVLMLSLASIAVLSRRQPAMPRVLAAAALTVLLLDPLAVLAPGFHLSFAAVGVLLWVARATQLRRSGLVWRAALGLRLLAGVQGALLLGLAPLTALLFAQVSIVAPAANLVAVPLFSLVTVPLALLGFVLDGPFALVGDFFLRVSAVSISFFECFLRYMAIDGLSSWPVANLSGLGLLCLVLPLARVLLPPGWPGRSIAWLAFLGLLAWRPAPPPDGCVILTVLDVGQGQAIVGRTRAHAFVYDTGPAYRSGGTAAERIVLPYLAHAGIRRIDRLTVSHSDLDHAGGLRTLVDAVPVRYIESGDRIRLPDRVVGRCTAGQSWNWDGVRFTFLHPPAEPGLDRNDASCVLLIEAGPRRVLLAGDIENGVETRLVQARVLPRVDVTTVPHHGSRTSSTVPYVRSLAPRHALVSAGWHNQWGFPKPDVVERWRNVGAEVVSTADLGAIEVELCVHAEQAKITEWRDAARRPWHARPAATSSGAWAHGAF